MLENKIQLTVSYEENGDLKKKNYIHAIQEDASLTSLVNAQNALSTILGEEVKGYTITKQALPPVN
jgi:hypothetical protein